MRKKILAIGNSFSQDATAKIESLTDEIYVRNLYIGGCSLERHIDNILCDCKNYEYQKNGVNSGDLVSIDESIKKKIGTLLLYNKLVNFLDCMIHTIHM